MKKYLPMLAKLGEKKDLEIPLFTYEIKLDGTRAIMYKEGNKINFINRRNNNITHRYPEFNFLKNVKAKSCVLDGEIVVYDKKKISRFNLLQHRDLLENPKIIKERSISLPGTFVIFDILELEGKSLVNLKQKERFEILKRIVKTGKNIEIIESSKDGKKLFKKISSKKGEGVIAKNPSEKYYEGKRVDAWIKIKNTNSIDAVIIGYTQEKRTLSTLLLGVYHNKKLIYIGKVGTGFSEIEEIEILKELEKIKTTSPAIENLPKDTIFVKPKLVCEAKYLEITKDKMMRAPVFLRMRSDRKPESCKLREQI